MLLLRHWADIKPNARTSSKRRFAANNLQPRLLELRATRPVYLDVLPLGEALVNQEVEHISTLVSLQLEDASEHGVGHYNAVAGEGSLEGLQNSLEVEIRRKTRDRRQALAAVALLNSDVDDVAFLSALGIAKRISGGKIYDVACLDIAWRPRAVVSRARRCRRQVGLFSVAL
jgi:hypothetical protein